MLIFIVDIDCSLYLSNLDLGLGMRQKGGKESYGAFSKYLQSIVTLMSMLLETRRR
jgi:hypothetical protein